MIKRLINFYRLASPNAQSRMREIWQAITTVFHTELAAALESGNEQKVQDILDAFRVKGGFHGIEDPAGFQVLCSTKYAEMDRLKATDIDFSLPDFCGFKCKTEGGVPIRFLLYCDVALLVRECAHAAAPEHVLEIGPGIGYLGVILCRWGAKSYTVIDLPTTAVFVAYFLSLCFGKDKVWLYGEAPDASRSIRIYPCTDYQGVLDRKYDAVCNVNSFPEIPHDEQRKYLELIADCLAPSGFFLSINHDSTVLGQRGVWAAMGEQTRLFCVSKVPSRIVTVPAGDSTSGYALSGYFDEVWQLK